LAFLVIKHSRTGYIEQLVAYVHKLILLVHYNDRCFVLFSGIFTVMCYNVLCDKYATRQMYGYCPSWALEWEYRKKGILDEIRHYAADIISLQVRLRS
jgi:mRNA deadenylase 3'-5' endonuclease subunit Ccr4